LQWRCDRFKITLRSIVLQWPCDHFTIDSQLLCDRFEITL
jgi:hypothetical protein